MREVYRKYKYFFNQFYRFDMLCVTSGVRVCYFALYSDENVRELWDLKYNLENAGAFSIVDEDPQPLFACLRGKFMWDTLVHRFGKDLNSTENGIKGRSYGSQERQSSRLHGL